MSIPVFKPFMHDGDRAYLTATDAFCVATYGHQVITTPNMKFIPQSFDNESDIIQARADGRYWAVDPFQWPQMYDDSYARSFAIPHREAYMDDSSMTYAWFRPAFAFDFVPLAPSNLFGQLKTNILDHLKQLYEKANKWVSSYKLTRRHKEDHVVGWVHAMHADYECFQQAMACRDIVMVVAEYQCRFLDIWALLDYFEIIKPCMHFVDTTHNVNPKWMGSFTQDVAIATKVHAAGVPVWLICDARLVHSNMNIVKVISFTPPDDLVIGMYHHPVKIFAQPFDIIARCPSNCQRHEAARQPYSNFEKLPESLVGKARVDKGKAKAKLAPYDATAPRQNRAVSGCDKWSDIDHPYMPPMNSFFKTALQEAKKEFICIKHPRDKMDNGYSLPDPGLFVNVLSPQSLMKYLANWLACCPTWLERHAQGPPDTLTSRKTSKSKAATAALFHREVTALQALSVGASNVHWRRKDIAISTLDNPPADLVRQISDEICEQSFRYELLNLDEHLGRDARKDKEVRKERMELLHSIFPSKLLRVWNKDFPQENDGLNVPSFDAALPYFESFHKVLSTWEHFPESLKQPLNDTRLLFQQYWLSAYHSSSPIFGRIDLGVMKLLPFSVGPLVGGGLSRSLAYFSIILRYYKFIARPAPLQLLARSYFSCTPISPSLAVDLQLLELVKTLFVHITPNTTAWCETLEVFLAGRGYQLTTKRKFEIEKLECSYRQTVNEHKLNSHVNTAIQQRNPTIQKLVSSYNSLCADLSAVIRQRRSSPNAIAPNPISPAGIFNLDVDADIWQDIGLDDVVPEPPDWLADEVTCAAIRLEWAIVEWDALQRARAHASDDNVILYHMDLRARQFIDLVLGWQTKVRPIPCAWPMPDCWGPSHTELANVTHMVYPDVHDDKDDVGEDRDDWESDIGFGDDEFMDVLEDIALADQYRGEEPN
ncbi:hypothetical protein EV702DRAFT_1202555 [Suillus placidus]|uniref:Uncharacterized protein n=1 Tax=Suillus placidus TaxID=48579 RepID=A0A9P6ZKH7_9AGAM|nr:hypothetical protein EV702DRAFT_1202555 [Suillus placidus]